MPRLTQLLDHAPDHLKNLILKINEGKRIKEEDAMLLYQCDDLSLLGHLATLVKKKINGNNVFFNRNMHIEPTNICINHCRFCSFRRNKGDADSWECSIEQMVKKTSEIYQKGYTEVHIVGGVHPDRNLQFYINLLSEIKRVAPNIHIKAFTAVEVAQMCEMSGISVKEGLIQLKKVGLNSMPGGGAELFDEIIRAKICPDKTGSTEWLKIHEEAHSLNIPTNCTMLYGLTEEYHHRIDHLNRLRNLQDKTHGFNVFIPLKFKSRNNQYAHLQETSITEDLKNFAVSRIFLDNIPHLKAYWPMLGKKVAQLALNFGVDDLDGTIEDSTKIYTMAGSEEQNPNASENELIYLIKSAGFTPIERDTLFNTINSWD